MAKWEINKGVVGARPHTQKSIEAASFEHKEEFIVFYSKPTDSARPFASLMLRADDVHTIERIDA